MIICTSISPRHVNTTIQHECVKSWLNFGEVFSFNTKDEIEVLQGQYEEVKFIETHRTVKGLFNKPLTPINYFFDFAIQKKEGLVIVNSDVLVSHLPVFKEDGVSMLTRNDYESDTQHSTAFVHGYDMFYIPVDILNIYPPLPYGLGCPFWDISLPYRALKNNIPLYWPQGKYIFHKTHPNQYSHEEWVRTGEAFKWEFGVEPHIPVHVALQSIMFKIKSESIK